LREIVPNAVPIERCLTADVQPFESALELLQAGVELKRGIGSSVDAASQAREPTRPHVVDRKVRGDTQGAQFLGGYRTSRLDLLEEIV
jgi:hypothetical protein